MSFANAVRSVLTQYVGFSGRARRSEYWWYVLFVVILDIVVGGIDAALGSSILSYIVGLALFLPGLAVAIRRLHDTNRAGWWIFIVLVPLVGAIVLIVFLVQDSSVGANKYGASPKEIGYGGGGAGNVSYGMH